MAKQEDNTANFTISGKISLAIVIVTISFLISIGTMTANYLALEKRTAALEQQQEKTCTSINHIEILNTRIETNLTHIKESLSEHMRSERGSK